MPAYIITGGSKGLGAELAAAPAPRRRGPLRVARRKPNLRQEASSMKGHYTFHAYDLAQTDGLDSLMERILGQVDGGAITLINNAGQLEPMTSSAELTKRTCSEACRSISSRPRC